MPAEAFDFRAELAHIVNGLRTTRELEPHFYRLFKGYPDLIEWVRGRMEDAREAAAPRPAPVDLPQTSMEQITDHLRRAGLGLQQFGATDAQITIIARLAHEQGLDARNVCGTSGLTRREASYLISDLQKSAPDAEVIE